MNQRLGRHVRKCTIEHVRPAKIQISLRIRAVWSESSLGAFWIAKNATFLRVDNGDSDRTARMLRLRWAHMSWVTFSDIAIYTETQTDNL